jgi:hypothetical protein
MAFVEGLARDSGWAWRRISRQRALLHVDSLPHPLTLSVDWFASEGRIRIGGCLAAVVPQNKISGVRKILAHLNENLKEGRFMWCGRSKRPIFRQSFLGKPRSILMRNRIENTLKAAVKESEKLWNALYVYLSEIKTPEEASFAFITPVAGEA